MLNWSTVELAGNMFMSQLPRTSSGLHIIERTLALRPAAHRLFAIRGAYRSSRWWIPMLGDKQRGFNNIGGCLFHAKNFINPPGQGETSSNSMAKVLKSSIPYKGPSTENLIEFIKNGLRKNSDQTIIIDSKSDRSWTGKEIETKISLLADFLIKECKLKKGDVCTLYGEPNDKFSILILAVISAGGVSNFVTNKYRAREVLDTSKVIGTKYLISTRGLLQNAQPELAELQSNLHVISCDEKCDGFENGCKTIGQLLEKCSPTNTDLTLDSLIACLDIKPDCDYAVIQFSSGTTGKPKPIPRTHSNLCHLVASVDHEELMNMKPGEVIAGSLPITHRPGLWALLACINNGSTFVLWNNLSDVEEALKIIEKYKVTVFSSSLPFLSMLGNIGIRIKDKYDLSSWQHIITSGAKIVHSDLPRSLVKEFNLMTLRQCFGMTESGWVFLIEKSLAEDNYLSVGHVVPGMDAIVIDRTTCKPLESEVRGEIALKSPQIFHGYLTDKTGVFNRSDFTDDGWFRTGDQGYYDKNDLVFIEGRYKELLIFENSGRFFPNEIETVISQHPAVEGSCVVKIGECRKPHPYDIARAYVTLKHGSSVTEKELLHYIADRSHEITLEGGIRILDQFPRLQNGKVDKQALKDMN